MTHAVLFRYPEDGSTDGDWLLAYEGSGGTNDVTAFVLIDAATGLIDEAGWSDPGDYMTSMTLADLIAMETSNYAGNVPNDNAPSTVNVQSSTPGSLTFTWPASPLGTYYLEQNSDLSTTNWVLVTNQPVVVGGQNQVIITGPQTGSMFYQLVAYPGL